MDDPTTQPVPVTAPPRRCPVTGHLLASDGRPEQAIARAAFLAKDGLATDPLGLVSDAAIAGQAALMGPVAALDEAPAARRRTKEG